MGAAVKEKRLAMGGWRTLRVFRYDPGQGGAIRYDSFHVPATEQSTVLDALAWVQTNQDPTLAFRYACRVGMCGTCTMVVNGRERWTCRTRLSELAGDAVTVRPLYHFPLLKDLVVDMAAFQAKLQDVGAALVPAPGIQDFALISPDSTERRAIDPAIQCIGCGACVSACTMVGWRPEFPGPAALLRAFTLIEDSRDRERKGRLAHLLSEDALWHCHTQQGCTAVCPMQLDPAGAIARLKRAAVATVLLPRPAVPPAVQVTRRRFGRWLILGLGATVALPLVWLLGVTIPRPARTRRWVPAGPAPLLEVGRPHEVPYTVSGLAEGQVRPVRKRAYLLKTPAGLVAFDPRCTHRACPTRWDEETRLFLCPCHGGGFDLEGRVVKGPPPRPLNRIEVRVEGGRLYLHAEV